LFCFDVATGRILSQWQIGGRFVGVDVSPDGRLVAGGTSISGYVYVYDAKTGKLLLRLDTDQGTHYRLTFSPDSTLLATRGTRTWKVKIWKMPSPALETQPEGK
jgi:WD40 repeat protein